MSLCTGLMGRRKKIVSRLLKRGVLTAVIAACPSSSIFSVNVLAAISQVRFRICVITTDIGILPRAFIVNSLGVGLESLFDQRFRWTYFCLGHHSCFFLRLVLCGYL